MSPASRKVQVYAPAGEVVGLGSGTTQVTTGANFACALTSAGAIKCWGDDNAGALGDGGTTGGGEYSATPVSVVSSP